MVRILYNRNNVIILICKLDNIVFIYKNSKKHKKKKLGLASFYYPHQIL